MSKDGSTIEFGHFIAMKGNAEELIIKADLL